MLQVAPPLRATGPLEKSHEMAINSKLFDTLFSITLAENCGRFSYDQEVQLIILDCLTKEMCIALHLVTKQIINLGKKSGWLFAALYLKQGSDSFQKDWSVYVSFTGSGLPRIIPTFHRKEILRRTPF